MSGKVNTGIQLDSNSLPVSLQPNKLNTTPLWLIPYIYLYIYMYIYIAIYIHVRFLIIIDRVNIF